MGTPTATVTEQPTTRTDPRTDLEAIRTAQGYTNAAISELERTEGKNIREVNREGLVELAASIKEHGILEPVLVTRTPKGLRLVAGFRRVAAAKMIGSKSVPARVLELNDLQVLESQLVENLQRQDLSPIEEAKALKALLEASGLTQEAIGKKIGKSQPYVANRIRLLQLPPTVTKKLEAGAISASHAEVLAKAPTQIVHNLVAGIENRNWSVQQLSQEAKWKTERFNDAKKAKEEFSAAVAKSKFPTCPVRLKEDRSGRFDGKGAGISCGRKAFRQDYRGGNWVNDGLMGHTWSLATGKEPEAEKATSGAQVRRDPAPVLPFVDAETAFAAPPASVVSALAGKSPRILAVLFHPNGKKGELLIRVETTLLPPKGVGGFILGGFGALTEIAPYGEGTAGRAMLLDCEQWNQQRDADRKRLAESKQAFLTWGDKLRGRSSPKKKA